jgi:hypothetical protein
MSSKQDERTNEALWDFLVFPLIVLIGIYVVAAVLDSILGLNNQSFVIIFTGIGGFGFIIYYFKTKIEESMKRKE